MMAEPRSSHFSVHTNSGSELNFLAVDDPDKPVNVTSGHAVDVSDDHEKMPRGSTASEPKPPSPPSSKRATRVGKGLELVQEESEPPTAEASRARLSAVAKPEPSKAKAKRGFMGGIMRGMGHAIASATGQASRTHGQQLQPASSSEMSGWLYKQGTNSLKNSAWQKRERQAAAARARSGCALWLSDPLALLPSPSLSLSLSPLPLFLPLHTSPLQFVSCVCRLLPSARRFRVVL